jgi:hypothetical protein
LYIEHLISLESVGNQGRNIKHWSNHGSYPPPLNNIDTPQAEYLSFSLKHQNPL